MNLDATILRGVALPGRLILGGVFVYAGAMKLASPQDFADTIAAYQLLPASAINVLALGLPVFELVCGLLVLTGVQIRVGVLGMLAMLVGFGGVLAVAQWRGLLIDCGCFGEPSWLDAKPAPALLRDGILLAIALLLYPASVGTAREEVTPIRAKATR